MEVKPGYKQTVVGVIPEEWSVRSLVDVAEIRTGIAKNSNISVIDPVLVHYLRVANVQDGFLDLSEMSKIQVSRNDLTRYAVLPGDMLMNEGGDLDKLARGSIWRGEFSPCVHQNHVFVVRCGSTLSPEFLNVWTGTAPARRYFLLAGKQTTNLASINKTALGRLPVAVPSSAEQRAIAGALSDVDALIGGLDQLIAKKRDLKQAAMQQLLTGQTRLPGFHGEWAVKRLGDVTALIPGGVYGEEKSRDGLIPCRIATTAHIDEDDTWNSKEMNVRYFSREQIEHYSPLEGDLIVVKSSGSAAKIQSGKIGFVDRDVLGRFLFSNFLMLLRPVAVSPRFLYFYLCSHNVKKLLPTLVEASTYPNIRIPEYLALEIPIPPLPEQTAIAEVLSDMDAELAALEQRRDKTRALKQGMMQELLTGNTRLV